MNTLIKLKRILLISGSDNINNKKRLLIMLLLTILIFILFSITKTYEKKLVKNKNIEVMNNYNIFKKTKNYKEENGERYIRYYEKNKNLTYEEIVTRVNIGLDYGFYNYIKSANTKKDILVLVNKYSKLNKNYIPNDLESIDQKYFINGNKDRRLLRKEARIAFEKLSSDSIKNNTPVYGQSAYRSYNTQELIYNNELKNKDQILVDRDTARPGHSEHQTGLTIDVSSTKNGNMLIFENTDSYKWLENNAYKYGFILRYPKGKENIHGYTYESWHYRYVGIKVAKYIHDNNLTFDEYYYLFIDK